MFQKIKIITQQFSVGIKNSTAESRAETHLFQYLLMIPRQT